jgi:hypothetical protein
MATATFKSFRDLARAVHADDVRKAENLRKAAALPKPKVGPKVAR